ncbi:MAG: hypothetical protein WCK59_04060 [Candidatus Falkowbacteria bacterium]
MNNIDSINKFKGKSSGLFSQKKPEKKVSLSLHIMPRGHESKDVRVFSWLIAGLLIVSSLIIFLMMYV